MTFNVPEYECTEGCYIVHLKVETDPITDECHCPRCGAEAVFKDYRPAKYVCVAAYIVDRAYGGPEEGGWYYDTGTRIDETVRCFQNGDFAQIREYRELLTRRYGTKVDIRNYGERIAPASFPETRPFYC